MTGMMMMVLKAVQLGLVNDGGIGSSQIIVGVIGEKSRPLMRFIFLVIVLPYFLSLFPLD